MEFERWVNCKMKNNRNVGSVIDLALRQAFESGAQKERTACAKVCKLLADCNENTSDYRAAAAWCREQILARSRVRSNEEETHWRVDVPVTLWMSLPVPPNSDALLEKKIDFNERCALAAHCLPDSEYRTRLEDLHSEMLHEILMLRSTGKD